MPVLIRAGVDEKDWQSDLDVVSTDSGRQALELLGMFHADLLLVGLHLTDMSPWDLVAKVRMRIPATPWMLLSSSFSQRDEIRARSLGALAVITPEELPLVHTGFLSRARRA